MPSEPEVFLSYSSNTKLQAEQLQNALRQQGIHAWAAFNVEPGQSPIAEAEKALDRAQACVVMVGDQAEAGGWLQWEWRTVLEKVWRDSSKKLVPLIVGKSEVPVWLRSWAPIKIDPKSDVAIWSDKVLKAIRNGHKNGSRPLTQKEKEAIRVRFKEIEAAAQQLKRFESREALPTVDSGS